MYTCRSQYKEIGDTEPIFKGESIFIIGGGTSLKDFDFSILKGKNVIVINKGLLSYPEADALYFTDVRFYKWHKEDIDKFDGLKFTNKPQVMDNVINLLNTGREGLELKSNGLRHGNNSGYAAINLAYHLGAKNIILLGYDMYAVGDKHHFHGGYGIKLNPRLYHTNMLPFFPTLVEPLKKQNVNIWNVNRKSKLNCFPFINLEDALKL